MAWDNLENKMTIVPSSTDPLPWRRKHTVMEVAEFPILEFAQIPCQRR